MRYSSLSLMRRSAYAVVTFALSFFMSIWIAWRSDPAGTQPIGDSELIVRFFAVPAAIAAMAFFTPLAFAASPPALAATAHAPAVPQATKPFMAQVVGLEWLNPLQRMDYPTEWQLLWTMGMVGPNPDDDMVKKKPQKFSTLQAIAPIAGGDVDDITFKMYHRQYLSELVYLYRDIYFTDSEYFYNAHSRTDKSTWRELAGIHVEYALPAGRFDPVDITAATREEIIDAFDIGLPSFPNSWTRSTPPDVRVTMGGPNAGFTSLAAGLDYLRAHPSETVWVMNWDAPSYPPKNRQINENLVQLILAGPDFKTGRAPLAWLGYPASAKIAEAEVGKNTTPRAIQAWKTAFESAARHAGKQVSDIGFVIHDAGKTTPNASDRLARLARTTTENIPDLDFMKQTFNTPALLGEMGAGTALTNVALAIAYANHIGKTVLVAGTSDEAQPVATVVVPPAVVRPIRADKPWFRARGGNTAYLPWWGLRHDAREYTQGYSR